MNCWGVLNPNWIHSSFSPFHLSWRQKFSEGRVNICRRGFGAQAAPNHTQCSGHEQRDSALRTRISRSCTPAQAAAGDLTALAYSGGGRQIHRDCLQLQNPKVQKYKQWGIQKTKVQTAVTEWEYNRRKHWDGRFPHNKNRQNCLSNIRYSVC